MYERSLLSDSLAAAAISVEQIKRPVLLAAGRTTRSGRARIVCIGVVAIVKLLAA
ncbi:hypothetical protein AB0H88_48520 [Nonomuraea sp. NPDC050680]|uniref:hypothetical protein n=1 Tax=Nonomuraea sp. NPDC050680 TaxID=3154630 RepID=UPI0033CE60A4